jgi:hypothetical protein
MAARSKPSAFSIHQKRVAHIIVPMLYSTMRTSRADAVAPKGGLELRQRRHHEAQSRLVVGELALQIEEVGAGNVCCLEGRAAGHSDVRVVAVGRRRF